MEIVIEKVNETSLDEFWQVFSESIRQDFPGYSKAVIDHFLNKVYTKSAYQYWLTNNWKIIYVAKLEEAGIIGFAVIDRPYGGVCFLRWLGVLSPYRGKGAGTSLIKAWMNYAKEYGCHKIEVAGQPEAKVFYEKYGLDYEGKRNLSYFGINQYIFGKVLGQPSDTVMIKE